MEAYGAAVVNEVGMRPEVLGYPPWWAHTVGEANQVLSVLVAEHPVPPLDRS